MDLIIIRTVPTVKSTIGELHISGVGFQCWTLEDVVRPIKIPGETAIGYGVYDVIVTFSQRFQRDLPLLVNVPNFNGVRIHSGNTDKDTEGCILVGLDKGNNIIGRSHEAFESLFHKIQNAVSNSERVRLSIERGPFERGGVQTA